MGGGEVVETSIDGTKTGTTGNCLVDKVGELGTGKGEDGIVSFDQNRPTNMHFTIRQVGGKNKVFMTSVWYCRIDKPHFLNKMSSASLNVLHVG